MQLGLWAKADIRNPAFGLAGYRYLARRMSGKKVSDASLPINIKQSLQEHEFTNKNRKVRQQNKFKIIYQKEMLLYTGTGT